MRVLAHARANVYLLRVKEDARKIGWEENLTRITNWRFRHGSGPVAHI
jgi:hypothetical protein